MKAFLKLFLFFIFSFFTFFNTSAQSKHNKIQTIIIDAGHGGTDAGAVGPTYKKEKDVTLIVAKLLGTMLKEQFNDIKIVYTRTSDVNVELFKRTIIANEANGDLFISIHCNASKNSTAHGLETYVMGLHKTEANLEVARKENGSILLEKNYENNYEGFNPYSPEAYIIFSLYQSQYLYHSTSLAGKVQNQMVHMTNYTDRGVKQAGFLVLYKVAMPSILVEMGFISNPTEEVFLTSNKGQQTLAKAIFNAVREYKYNIEGFNNQANKSDTSTNTYSDEGETENIKQGFKENDNIEKTDNVTFKVQFATSSTQKSISSKEFKDLNNVNVYYQNGIWKYTVGNEKEMNNAVKLQKEMQNKGFKDAFIVAFYKNKRISNSEAQKLIQQIRN